MAMEPVTLFSRIADSAKVARRLREIAPNLTLDGPDDGWRSAVVSFEIGREALTITLTNDPEYYREPNWSTQMAGMEGYFSMFPKTERQSLGLMLPSTFQYSLGVLFDPDEEAPGDKRMSILYDIAELLDGVLFTPSALRDAGGRILFGASGEADEDPAAVWPRVLATVDISKPPADSLQETPKPPAAAENSAGEEPPSAARVARRALALTALTARVMLEQGEPLQPTTRNLFGWVRAQFSGFDSQRHKVLAWIDDIGIGDELEPDEWAVLQRPVGKLDTRSQIQATWRLEGLVVLAWALGRFEIPPHDQLVRWHPLWANLGLHDPDAARELLASPTLRTRDEIRILRDRLFTLHWRLRNFWIKPDAIDLPAFARTNTFGLDVSDIPLIECDLALHGQRIDRAPADTFSLAHSISLERHLAANWLWEGPEKYSDSSQDT